MSGLSEYQNVFRVSKQHAANNSTSPQTMKRNRQPVSCSACRKRKQKCDRQVPCSLCIARGMADSCNFPNGTKRKRDGHEEGFRTSEAQIRLQKLEDMVTSLIQTTKGGIEMPSDRTPPDSVMTDQRTEVLLSSQLSKKPSAGRLDVVGSETNYLGATHWTSILENIREIQGFLKSDKEDESEDRRNSSLLESLDVVFDSNRSLTLTDVCNSLPPRPIVDKILSYWFNARYFQSPIIHNGKFLREYESFWADPSSTSFLWISILFSLLFMGSQIGLASCQEVLDPSESATRSSFFTKAAQALVAGKYRKSRPHSVEALLLYASCHYMSKKGDQDTDAWMITGLSARLAMRMGYHRDPRHLPDISPFEGEMRRRTWSILRTFELLLSFQTGLPAIMHEEETDTDLPSNLFDEDLDEDCKILPTSRPDTDLTPMLYWCYKARLAKLFRRITQHALSLSPRSYQDIMKLDAEIHEIHAQCPPSLRIKPLSSSFTDQTHTILFRMNVDLLYQKSLCVLHRNYFSYQNHDQTFENSRTVCTDAALAVLEHQADFYFATQPGGQLYSDRWMLSSLTLHDFLLASMITCLDLYESEKTGMTKNLQSQVKKYDALKLSHEIWTSRAESSRDARRASDVLAVMLSKVQRPNKQSHSIHAQEMSSPLQQNTNGHGTMETQSEASEIPISSPWNTTGFGVPGQGFDMGTSLNYDPSDPLNSLFGFDTIDWGLFDQYLSVRGNAVPSI